MKRASFRNVGPGRWEVYVDNVYQGLITQEAPGCVCDIFDHTGNWINHAPTLAEAKRYWMG